MADLRSHGWINCRAHKALEFFFKSERSHPVLEIEMLEFQIKHFNHCTIPTVAFGEKRQIIRDFLLHRLGGK